MYLNVWAPTSATGSARKPVVVWIYGGGFTIGSAAMANYSGETLARKGVVYVSVAYRLGALGFMAHPELTAESRYHGSGNWGFLDLVAALEWIQRNIEHFGGDPSNVTIMGQSAGSMAVSLLQASPLARGLFHRAVGMSGASFGNGDAGRLQSLAAAEEGGVRLQQELKASNLAAMRSLSADRILQAQLAVPIRYSPLVDGHSLTQSPAEIFRNGKQNDVPIMIGFTRDESFSDLARAVTLEQYRSAAERLYGSHSSQASRALSRERRRERPPRGRRCRARQQCRAADAPMGAGASVSRQFTGVCLSVFARSSVRRRHKVLRS